MFRTLLGTFTATTVVVAAQGGNLADLQKRVLEEQQRILIAKIATDGALKNSTLQERILAHSNQLLAVNQPRLSKSQADVEQAQSQLVELKAILKDAKHQYGAAEDEEVIAKKETEKSEAKKDEAEKEAQAEISKAKTVLPQHTPVFINGLGLFSDWLRQLSLPCQNVVAALAGIIGMTSIPDGEIFLEAVTIGSVAIAAGFSAKTEAYYVWGDEMGDMLQFVFGAEVALVVAVAAMIGFDGFRLLIGATYGLAFAHITVGNPVVASLLGGMDSLWFVIWLLIGVLGMAVGKRQTCAVVGILSGGLLFASFVSFFMVEVKSSNDTSLSWLDCAEALIGAANSEHIFGEDAASIRFTSLAVGAVVALLGLLRWFSGWPATGGEGTVAASSPQLRDPLLADSEDPSAEHQGRQARPSRRGASSRDEGEDFVDSIPGSRLAKKMMASYTDFRQSRDPSYESRAMRKARKKSKKENPYDIF
eukprot:TRINITY_DN115696_c0_g1_i1.p1 TRINITY_DN115696_c0_g1~~TRINITY_DN115696_c0_g1_i1.p1  ORF type:complete len:477 (-),score=100.80 TRINITY_DN115696_c0_g1_i1:45-1475(-)